MSCRIAFAAGDQSLHVRPGWTGRKSFVLKESWTINASSDVGRTPSARRRMAKESAQCLDAGGHRPTAPTALSIAGQKRIHIFQANIVERTILLAQPTQKLLYMPSLAANGDCGQTALAVLVSGKVV